MKASDLVDLPKGPNFLRLKDSNLPISISAFTDTDLRKIGKRWTDDLIKRAQEKRKLQVIK